MPTSYIFGIDPGFKGGLALITSTGLLRVAMQMPTKNSVTSVTGSKKEINGEAFARAIDKFLPVGAEAICAIEDVSAMPGQGVTGMFRFGFGAGLVTGIAMAKGIRVIRIKPAVWKSALGLSASKVAAVAKANKLFGVQGHHFDIKQDGPAEAALIAYFAATRFAGASEPSIYD